MAWRMKCSFRSAFAAALLCITPAQAIVGGAAPSTDRIGRSVISIVGSRGNFCSGVLIAPRLVLTAGHCVQPGAEYRIVEYDADRKPDLKMVRRVAVHPAFNLQTMLGHRATADVALLELDVAARETVAVLSVPQTPITPGGQFAIAGVGVTVRGDGKSSGLVRSAALIATGKPGTLQIRLVDPAGQGNQPGLGACTGDSGGPVFEEQSSGSAIIGVISWSTGPNGSDGCGGLTGVTPLTLYRDWILKTARQWGFAL
jgi:secreted trypsin-like serine protease